MRDTSTGIVLLLLLCTGLLPLTEVPTRAQVDISSLAQEANTAYYAGDYYRAIGLYKTSHEEIRKRMASPGSSPGLKAADADILSRIADCYSNTESPAMERRWLQDIIDLYGSESDLQVRCAYAQYAIAESYASDRLLYDAEEAANRVAAAYPTRKNIIALALLLKGRSQFKRKDYTSAEGTFLKLVSDYSDKKAVCADAKLELARTLLEEGRLNHALVAFSSLKTEWAYSREELAVINMGIGLCYECKGYHANAEDWFSRVIDDFSDTGSCQQAYFQRAMARIRLGKYDNAMEDIPKITVKHLQEYSSGSWYYAKNEHASASAHYELVLAHYPEGPAWPTIEPSNALDRLVDCYTKLGDAPRAEDARTRLEAFLASH